LPLEADKDYTVKVTHVENPTCFWCQIVDPENKLQKLIDSLQEKYIDSTDTVDKIDTACIAKCKGDGLFYRGVTRSNVENGEIVVLFVDYGSVYYIEASEVKSIKGEDLELPIQAVDCMLHDIDLDESQDDWDETVCEYFERLLDDTTLSMKVKQVCNEGVSVYLYDGGIDLSIDLADKGFVNLVNSEYNTPVKDSPKKRESAEILGRILSTDCEYRVIISHVETPSCFYVLFKDNAVESIEEKINSVVEINSNDVLQEEDLIQGMLCLACCKDVNDWQRAKIENIQEDCVMVIYLYFKNLLPIKVFHLLILTLPKLYQGGECTSQASTLTFFLTCPFGELTKKSTCPTQSFSCPKKKIDQNYKNQRIVIRNLCKMFWLLSHKHYLVLSLLILTDIMIMTSLIDKLTYT
jgi:tudor domain-containing protein 1/4/6/7